MPIEPTWPVVVGVDGSAAGMAAIREEPLSNRIGAGQLAWISLELVYLPELSVPQAIYGAVGLALVLLPLMPSARSHLRYRAVSAS